MFGPPRLILRPPLDGFDQLVEPLSAGDLRITRALATLEPGWTVYVKPRVGLDRPDFIALHDELGVCVVETLDWQPETTRRTDDGDLEVVDGDGTWRICQDEPRIRAKRSRSSIFDQFYALPEHGGTPTSAIRSVLLIPGFRTTEVRHLFEPGSGDDTGDAVTVFGGDSVDASIRDIVVGLGCTVPPAESMSKLKQHIVASERVCNGTTGWRSDAVRDLALNPSGSTVRRLRGSAGSGKSFGVTARAAHLAAEGKRVLVLSLNVTFANRLRSMVNDRCRELGANPTLVACSNFHSFCTRVVQDAEMSGHHLVAPRGAPWTVGIVAKAEQAYATGCADRYDAVLVDEGQDFTIEWWNLLRDRVVVPGGEMLVVADPTQDIYDRYSWTSDVSFVGAGQDADWGEIHESCRLPPDLLALSNEFASEHLDGEQMRSRVSDSGAGHSADGGSMRRWVDVDRVNALGRAVGREVVRLLRENPTLRPKDVAFVCDYHHDGVAAVRVIEAAGIPVHHIFSRDPDAPRRRRKHRFWPDADAVKGCTAHSLKGWEMPAVVLGIGVGDRALPLAYVAMTRVAIDPRGGPSYVSVVNADVQLRSFGERFVTSTATARAPQRPPVGSVPAAPASALPPPVPEPSPLTPPGSLPLPVVVPAGAPPGAALPPPRPAPLIGVTNGAGPPEAATPESIHSCEAVSIH